MQRTQRPNTSRCLLNHEQDADVPSWRNLFRKSWVGTASKDGGMGRLPFFEKHNIDDERIFDFLDALAKCMRMECIPEVEGYSIWRGGSSLC
jgi:hypothetical protein